MIPRPPTGQSLQFRLASVLRLLLCFGLFRLPIGFKHRGLVFSGDNNTTEYGVCAAFSELEAGDRFREVKTKLSCDLRSAAICGLVNL